MSASAERRVDRIGAALIAAVCAVGVFGLAGWHLGSARMVSVMPTLAPIQYNTALEFVVLGAALGLLARGVRRAAAGLGWVMAVVSGLTLWQYVSGADFGIDELFMSHGVTWETSHPGRMAPNTAVAFVLSGLALAALGGSGRAQRTVWSARGMGAAVGLIGAVALAGYAVNVEPAYGWGKLTRMAVLASIGFTCAGAALWRVAGRDLHGARDAEGARSIAFKVSALAAATTLAGSATVGVWIYRQLARELVRDQRHLVENALALSQERFTSQVEMLRRDVAYLRDSARARTAAAWLGEEGSEEQTRVLESFFAELLAARPDYMQIRLIEATAAGREAVRVERRGDGSIAAVGADSLQERGHTSYVRESTGAPAGQVVLSEIELNREDGEVSGPRRPVLRGAAAVRVGGANGERNGGAVRGVVVINMDVARLLSDIRGGVPPGYAAMVYNGRGDYLVHPDREKEFAFEFGESAGIDVEFPEARRARARHDARSFFELAQLSEDGDRVVMQTREWPYDPTGGARRIGIAIVSPYEKAVAATVSTRVEALAAAVIATLGSIGIATVVARSMTRALRRLTEAVRAFGRGERGLALPVEARDESGVLARAFADMMEQVEARRAELERENAQRRLAEARLAEANAGLEEKNQQLEQFAYVASHDLQEPLRKIQTFGDLVRSDHATGMDEEGLDYLERMQTAAGRMRRLIEDLLTYARVTSKAQPFEDVDLNEVAAGVVSDLEVRISQSGGRVLVGALPVVRADGVQMRQLLQNLIGNALKFHRDDAAPEVKVRARRLEGDGEARWALLVEDNGIGFEQKYAERIFAPFQRLHGRGQFEGTGMGLAVCKRIVERHGWRIDVTSEPGRGSTFRIVCGAAAAPAEGAMEAAPREAALVKGAA